MAPPVTPQLLHSALSKIQECAPTTRASLAGRRTWALRLRWRDRRTPADPPDGRTLAIALAGHVTLRGPVPDTQAAHGFHPVSGGDDRPDQCHLPVRVVAIQPRDADEIDPSFLEQTPRRFGGAILKDSVMKLGRTLIRTWSVFGPMAFALTLSASTPGHADDYGSCGPNCVCPSYDDSSSCAYDYPYGF